MKKLLALLVACCMLAGCATGTGPGASVRWTGYPALGPTTFSYNWLVVKCQLSDVQAIPAALDLRIQQFLGIAAPTTEHRGLFP